MLPASLERIERELARDAVVLDVGGWARPLARADWVIDLLPYETRGLYGRDGDGPERFDAGRWVVRDLCDREPYPFADDSIDFVVCSQTLEDVRDPVWVCSEITRIGRAGYVEVPSRLEEQSMGVHGPWAGWSHHRWLIDVGPNEIELVHKPHLLHARESDHFPYGYHAALTSEQRVQTLWWSGRFDCAERVIVDPDEFDRYLADFVAHHRRPAESTPTERAEPRGPGRRLRSALRDLRRG